MSTDNVTHVDFGRRDELDDASRKLEDFGYDPIHVGAQMLANVELHQRHGELSTEQDGVNYSIGFVEGLLHAKTGRLDFLADELRELIRAIAEHRTAVRNAGLVRVDERDEPAAEAKHAADERLWSMLEGLQ